jgi:hypothetical protein
VLIDHPDARWDIFQFTDCCTKYSLENNMSDSFDKRIGFLPLEWALSVEDSGVNLPLQFPALSGQQQELGEIRHQQIGPWLVI